MKFCEAPDETRAAYCDRFATHAYHGIGGPTYYCDDHATRDARPLGVGVHRSCVGPLVVADVATGYVALLPPSGGVHVTLECYLPFPERHVGRSVYVVAEESGRGALVAESGAMLGPLVPYPVAGLE